MMYVLTDKEYSKLGSDSREYELKRIIADQADAIKRLQSDIFKLESKIRKLEGMDHSNDWKYYT